MNEINNKQNWADLKEKIKAARATITDEDVVLNDGEEIDLLTGLQKKIPMDKIISTIDE